LAPITSDFSALSARDFLPFKSTEKISDIGVVSKGMPRGRGQKRCCKCLFASGALQVPRRPDQGSKDASREPFGPHCEAILSDVRHLSLISLDLLRCGGRIFWALRIKFRQHRIASTRPDRSGWSGDAGCGDDCADSARALRQGRGVLASALRGPASSLGQPGGQGREKAGKLPVCVRRQAAEDSRCASNCGDSARI
jgi:hypothetical protein